MLPTAYSLFWNSPSAGGVYPTNSARARASVYPDSGARSPDLSTKIRRARQRRLPLGRIRGRNNEKTRSSPLFRALSLDARAERRRTDRSGRAAEEARREK